MVIKSLILGKGTKFSRGLLNAFFGGFYKQLHLRGNKTLVSILLNDKCQSKSVKKIFFFFWGGGVHAGFYSFTHGMLKRQHQKNWRLSAALETTVWQRRGERGWEAVLLEAATAPSCLITPLSLPSLLFPIVRAALQYFYQMISPCSSAALMFMKMILHRNASSMPRCHCLSSSLASTCMFQSVCAWGLREAGGGGI